MKEGIYESIISQLTQSKLKTLDRDTFYIQTVPIDKEEAAHILAQYLYDILRKALGLVSKNDALEKQLELANKVIFLIRDELDQQDFEEDVIAMEGKMLKAIISKLHADFVDLDRHLAEITPYSRLIYSELFTGGNTRLPLDGELKKEILSSDKIDLLVSFIKWSGLRLILPALESFVKRGGTLRVIGCYRL